MTMDSAASFLLEGVLKLVGAPNRFSWAGLALDLSEAAEKMAARLLAGVNASLEAFAARRGVAATCFSGGEGSELVDSVSAVEGTNGLMLLLRVMIPGVSEGFSAGEAELDWGDSGSAGRVDGLATTGVGCCLHWPLQVNNWQSKHCFLLSQERDLSFALLAGVLASSSLDRVGSGCTPDGLLLLLLPLAGVFDSACSSTSVSTAGSSSMFSGLVLGTSNKEPFLLLRLPIGVNLASVGLKEISSLDMLESWESTETGL